MIIKENGPICACGNRGCLNSLASNVALCQSAREAVKEGRETLIKELANGKTENITVSLILKAAKEGDKLASRLLRQDGKYLGIGLANIINNLNPKAMVLNGETIGKESIVFKEARKTLEKYSLPI